ncbi:hypothetical protein M5K25_010376 [Dendrobium thyrsiflorum]|uniref:Ribosomal protein 50S-L18Ae/60S-L20/60S-L18A domain-containing protein n=1 Tax=Dendrobium thyrsiflorum TaxID=117978 RepID=A0ABD0V6J8_DENTH
MGIFRFHQYQVVGRALPTPSDEHPKIYRMKLWATNEVRAKSKFWYFLRKLKKVKKSNGQVLAINEVRSCLMSSGEIMDGRAWKSQGTFRFGIAACC